MTNNHTNEKKPVKKGAFLKALAACKLILITGGIFLTSHILQINLSIPLLLVSLAIFFIFSRRHYGIANFRLLELSLLYVLITSIAYFVIHSRLSIFYIPYCLVPILATLLFGDLWISFFISSVSAITIAAINGGNLYLAVLFLISGIIASLLVYNSRKRTEIIRAGILTGAVQVLALLFIKRFSISDWNPYLILLINSAACGIVILGILPLFEYLFRTVTNISLLELADFNHPLLQQLIQEAPGTYHHSLIVGNLSEAACKAVGAHALLSRIGAYYHDIGKLHKPEYFSENQDLGFSKHDTLSPAMSKIVIMNHVKEGIAMAKKYRLNPYIFNFIQQHHGNSLVFYFYRRALESMEENQEVEEEGFRYPGPKPNTKETAIVMLADSVEAACRAIKEHTSAKIQEVVHKVINNKFIDGQLDECELTLKDLEKISKIFIHLLTGIYRNRISYPSEESTKNEKLS